MRTAQRLRLLYDRMRERFGPQHWWPAETPFEVMVGAILTQNTNWKNVERAITNLRDAGVLSPAGLSGLPVGLLAEYIRPAGYYNIKAGRLRNLLEWIDNEYGGDPAAALAQPLSTLRAQLLAIRGIGPETADSILLYAAGLPIFVVDAYTCRILSRHQLLDEPFDYHRVQELFMDNLESDPQLYNEYHALLVRIGKTYCKKSKPNCADCPLLGL
ncbi:MAG: endonuclease III domain-containing protein [Desulfobulbus sp.]